MQSGHIQPVNQFSESLNDQDIKVLIEDHILNLENIGKQVDSNLSILINNFIEMTRLLLASYTTAGASDETRLKDLISVINVIAQCTPSNLVNLNERINTHQDAISIRKRTGIPSIVGGIGLCAGMGIAFFLAPISVPIVIGTCIAGSIMGISGTSVVVDSKRKRETIAECLQDILNYTWLSFILNNKFSEYTCAKLSIVMCEARKRCDNDMRDMILSRAIQIISKATTVEAIIESLGELEQNLRENSRSSNSAMEIKALLTEFSQLKEKRDKDLLESSTALSLSK